MADVNPLEVSRARLVELKAELKHVKARLDEDLRVLSKLRADKAPAEIVEAWAALDRIGTHRMLALHHAVRELEAICSGKRAA